jgi:hypothetical protein
MSGGRAEYVEARSSEHDALGGDVSPEEGSLAS